MMDREKIAITHASGLLAEALLESLANTGIKSENIILLDLQQQAGNRLPYADTYLTVEDQHEYDYENLIAVLLLEPDAELESLLQHADCFVISHLADADNSDLFIADFSTPPSLPEPPCSIRLASAELANLLLVTRGIHENYGITEINIVNVLSSSSYGKSGVDELASQTISLLNSQQVNSSVFPLQLAFNMIPIESTDDMEAKIRKALQYEELKCSVQNILVPAFHGQAISVVLETRDNIDLEQLTDKYSSMHGMQLVEYPVSPFTHCKSGTSVLITGLQYPQKVPNRLQFWIIADSIRNGLIQNYQNMLEILLKSFL